MSYAPENGLVQAFIIENFQGSDIEIIKYLIENGAGGKKIFVQNKKEQNVIDVAEQWCDYDSYKVLKDHFDSVTPPKVKSPIYGPHNMTHISSRFSLNPCP